MFQGKRFASRQSINLVAFCSSSITTFCEFMIMRLLSAYTFHTALSPQLRITCDMEFSDVIAYQIQ